jgi:hypothetical protein
MSIVNIMERFPCVKEVLKTRGKRYKASRACATDVVVVCPCCRKTRTTTDFALELHANVGNSPVGWCRTCGMSLKSHRDWADLLPELWLKHGDWTGKILYRFGAMKTRSRIRKIDFKLNIQDLPPIPTHCPIFPWVEFKVPVKRINGRAYANPRSYFNVSPSLDRIKPELGYVKGNIRWVSNRANSLRSNATSREIEALFLDSQKLDGEK